MDGGREVGIRHLLKIWICFSWQLSIPSLSINSEAADRKQVKTSRRDGAWRNPQPVIEAVCACDTHVGWLRCKGVRMSRSYWLFIALKMCDILKWCKKSDDVSATLKLCNITKHSRASVILSLCLCHSCCLECPFLAFWQFPLSSNSHTRFYHLSDNWPYSLYHSTGCPLLLCRTSIALLLDTYPSAVTSVYMSVSPVIKSRVLLPSHSNQEWHIWSVLFQSACYLMQRRCSCQVEDMV